MPLSYQVERNGQVHILWINPNNPNSSMIETLLCTYADEDATSTFPPLSGSGVLACQIQPPSTSMYSSLP
jgi:hypothetical protein